MVPRKLNDVIDCNNGDGKTVSTAEEQETEFSALAIIDGDDDVDDNNDAEITLHEHCNLAQISIINGEIMSNPR